MPKILTSTYVEVEFNYSELFILNHVNILMSGLRLSLLCDSLPQRKQTKPISEMWGYRGASQVRTVSRKSLTAHDDHMNEVCSENRLIGTDMCVYLTPD